MWFVVLLGLSVLRQTAAWRDQGKSDLPKRSVEVLDTALIGKRDLPDTLLIPRDVDESQSETAMADLRYSAQLTVSGGLPQALLSPWRGNESFLDLNASGPKGAWFGKFSWRRNAPTEKEVTDRARTLLQPSEDDMLQKVSGLANQGNRIVKMDAQGQCEMAICDLASRGSSIFLQDRLLDYPVQYVREAKCDDRLLVAVQREILQILRVKDIQKEKFRWPKNFKMWKILKGALKMSVLAGAKIGLAQLLEAPVPHIVEFFKPPKGKKNIMEHIDLSRVLAGGSPSTPIAGGMEGQGDEGLYIDNALKFEELLDRTISDKPLKLLMKKENTLTDVWADVPAGMLWQAYFHTASPLWHGYIQKKRPVEASSMKVWTKFSKWWKSPITQKTLAAFAIAMAFGHFIAPGFIIGLSAATAVLNIVDLVKVQTHLFKNVVYILMELAAWEQRVFNPAAGGSDSTRPQVFCDKGPCRRGFTCMRRGIFECLPNEMNTASCRPVCVASPWKPRLRGEQCTVGTECISGRCNYPSTADHPGAIFSMIGTCEDIEIAASATTAPSESDQTAATVGLDDVGLDDIEDLGEEEDWTAEEELNMTGIEESVTLEAARNLAKEELSASSMECKLRPER